VGKITSLPVIEIFHSVQGEGKLAGTPSVFIRLAGCPLRCPWCDTQYAWDPAKADRLSVDQIIDKIAQFPARHTVITGGEPLIHSSLATLSQTLMAKGYHTTIETAGVVYRKVPCDLLSLSPKLPSTLPDIKTFRPAILQKLLADAGDYQVKFVVADEGQVAETMKLLVRYDIFNQNNVMLMPNSQAPSEYRRIAAKIARLALENNLRFCPRLHLELKLK
jgi:7-carboxy-7-deazaguanine synthase